MDMLNEIKTIPLSVWIGTATAVIVLVGWYFNHWRVIGLKASFPYFEVAKPVPELSSVEPKSVVAGDSLTLHGAKLEAFDPHSSQVVIGATEARIINWHRGGNKIEVKVPQQLIPGRYPVSIQIGERQSTEDITVDVRMLPADLNASVLEGRRILVLVAQFDGAGSENNVQNDLLEQLNFMAGQYPVLQNRLLVRTWAQTISGNTTHRLQEITEASHAQLILFGSLGSGNNFYPKVYSRPQRSGLFEAKEQQLRPASLNQLDVSSDNTYPFSAEPLWAPLHIIRFLIALGHYQLNEYKAAENQFSSLLQVKGMQALDKASLYLALGRTQIRHGTEILEKPLRNSVDRKNGNALLRQGIKNLESAKQAMGNDPQQQKRKAQVYFNLAAATQGRVDITLKEKHEAAIEYLQQAIVLLDCEVDIINCIAAFNNLSMSYEWLASLQWDSGVSDDMLETCIQMLRKAIELHNRLVADNPQRPAAEQLSDAELKMQNAWLHNQLSISMGHYYRGDRDSNLKQAIELAEQALPYFLQQTDTMVGRIALTYNHIGHSYMLQAGDREQLLSKALENFSQGLNYVSPDHFPEFHTLLSNNKKTAQALVDEGYKMLEGEVANRYEASIDRHLKHNDIHRAQAANMEYLNWSWHIFRKPVRYAAYAHALMSRGAHNVNDLDLALWHAMSARTIMSSYERVDDQDHYFLLELEKKIVEYSLALGQQPAQVDITLANTRIGMSIVENNKHYGDERLAANQFNQAIEYYNQALYYYPYDPLILVNRSNTYSRSGDIESYVRDLENALMIYPDDPIALYNRALLYLQGEQWEKAITDIDRAFLNGAQDGNFYAARARAYRKLGNNDKAMVDYQSALARLESQAEKQEVIEAIKELKPETMTTD
jgi:tetratricopeptide (TPR) repeat protein